ncbi:MAG: virulence factor [Gaiellales bacterium]
MSEYQITYWRDIPSMVAAREGDETARAQLAQRFQEAIDEAAMRLGESDADAYMEGWRRGDWTPGEGTPAELAERIASDLEADLTEDRLTALLDELGPAQEA